MAWTPLDSWIAATGALCAMSCALLGNYLVLRRMSMMGDAISHAVLPGLAAAFLLTGSRDSIVMLLGAVVVGMATALLVQALHRLGDVDEGAAMGVVFTTLFALGLVLIRKAADTVDLDPGCVLYGAIELTPLDTVPLGDWEVPRAALVNAVMLAVNGLFVALFYKELKIASFDPAFATAMGISADGVHYMLMALVAMTAVAAFESVGSILVIAMFIVPAATSRLLTDRLGWMLSLSMLLAATTAVMGHAAAITVPSWLGFVDTSSAGMMATVAGAGFLGAFFFAPRYGIVSRAVRRGLLALRILQDDILGALYRRDELPHAARAPLRRQDFTRLLGYALAVRVALWLLARTKRIRFDRQGYHLTPQGTNEARSLVRSHRLWEAYAVDVLGVPSEEVHHEANVVEHVLDQRMRDMLEGELGPVRLDPHSREIPEVDKPV